MTGIKAGGMGSQPVRQSSKEMSVQRQAEQARPKEKARENEAKVAMGNTDIAPKNLMEGGGKKAGKVDEVA